MITGTLSSKGQVTIPKKIREILHVKTSDKIVFIPLEDGNVLITSKENPASELFGLLRHRKTAKTVSLKEMESVIQKRREKRKL